MIKKYDIIYADPPWKQAKGGKRRCRPNQGKDLDYPVLSIRDIKDILGNYESETLFMWTIDKFLFKAQEMGESLGFKLHARIIWDKTNGIAPAFTVRYSHEYLLWMYKSPMPKIEKDVRGKYTTVLREKATKHSKKPVCAYELIESLYPHQSRIELFARNRREGWASWGNELDKHSQDVPTALEENKCTD